MLGIVTGLHAEARVAKTLGRTETGGGTVEGARTAAERLVGAGADILLSFGLAGGLDPALQPGDLLVPQEVMEGKDRFPVNPIVRVQLGSGVDAPLLAADRVVSGAGYKAMLFRDTGACAVDLESGAVARVASRHGLPFAVLRAVCDPADRTLTPAALVGLDRQGGMAVCRVLAALMRQPGELPALLALGRDAGAARKSLLDRVAEIRRRGGVPI